MSQARRVDASRVGFYCGPTYCAARAQVNLERHLALVVYDFAVCYLTWLLGPSTL